MIDPSVHLPRLILASQSPRRQELLKRVGLSFRVVLAEVDERHDPKDCPRELVLRLSLAKGAEVAKRNPGEIVISSDTVVAVDDHVLGKPKDVQEACEMLARLSGRSHDVFTGYAFQFVSTEDGSKLTFLDAQQTRVEFYPLTSEQIHSYVASGEPMDKAGAYGIQDLGALLVKSIQGDYFNVMGFPVSLFYEMLRKMQI